MKVKSVRVPGCGCASGASGKGVRAPSVSRKRTPAEAGPDRTGRGDQWMGPAGGLADSSVR